MPVKFVVALPVTSNGDALVPRPPSGVFKTIVPAERLIEAPACTVLPELVELVRKNVPALPAWLVPDRVMLPVFVSVR